MKNVLIIFTKNPLYGKVKTRLAATVGNDKALEAYKTLTNHTHAITYYLNCSKIVFYTDEIVEDGIWKDYQKQLQHGTDLGERMMNAFEYVFQNEYLKAVIIGCDCPELTEQIIKKAFEHLDKYDVVIGPAADGGYYLLGMKKLYESYFKAFNGVRTQC